MDLFAKLCKSFTIPPFESKKGHFVVDDCIGISLLIATSYRKYHDRYLITASNLYKAQKIYNLLKTFLPETEVLLFPCDELIRAETIAQSKEMMATRLYVLDEIIKGNAEIVICNLASACRYLPDPDIFKEKTFDFEVGKSYDLMKLRTDLIKSGYQLVNKVDQSLQFAVRGDILDIFSVNNDNPVRIEFFDDEIESIRYFDLAKQTSTDQVKKITILPASDILLSEQETLSSQNKIFDVLEKDKEFHDYGTFESLRNITENDVSNILEGNITNRIYKYYSFLQGARWSIYDYCKDFVNVLVDIASLENSNDLLQEESLTYLNELSSTGKIISHLEMYRNLFSVVNRNGKNTIYTTSLPEGFDDLTVGIKSIPFQASKKVDAISIIESYLNENYTIILSLNSKSHINTIEEALMNLHIGFENVHNFQLPSKEKIGVSAVTLQSGFAIEKEKVVYLTSAELFNEKNKVARFDNRFKEATILKSFEDLEPGDYVVHEYQGIGQFVELQTLEIDGVHKDYIKIAYFGNEFLYVPLSQFQLVRKYLGKEGMTPRLSHLHSKDWENTKKRIKERVNDLAERLMHLYIERSKIKGFAFKPDDEFQEQFDNSFEHPLTPDQERAIREIKADMEKEQPMDRLLCGDVGFGKTEVAFEAAFKAINNGKQVAILCPTTLLARQHYENAMKRFSPFDVKIAIFSRLIPEKKQKQYIEEIAKGNIHLIIGTHRLLSKEISFKDLGLLIIDEEQRFGVEQKERMKELKSNIDVLTLSATPIPRTLQISLLGVRALSKIDTPPQERMPIQTYVTPFKLDVVKELIERELGRDGQVFYLHNNIETLYQISSRLSKLLPEAVIAVAHGQMSREEIEDVMLRFYRGEIDVLVCTSIVENGIDVPNANMIIVEDSEHYGLSQLYQIKGRVGRSNRIAYAYLMYSANKVLNEKAQKRLKAIQDFTELGSGYKIAQRDLMIRGAGDILGPEQAGFIDSIGLDMYIKLLNEAVQEKMTGKQVESPEATPSLSLDAYIPEGYAKDSDRIELYQEIFTCPSTEDLARIKVKTRDIYGKLPEEVELLFVKRDIDLLTREAKIDKLEDKQKTMDIILGSRYMNIRGIGNILFESLIPYLSLVKVTYANNVFKILLNKSERWIFDLENILKSLVNILENNKIQEIV